MARLGWSWWIIKTGYQKPPQMKIMIKRDRRTVDGIFGTLSLDFSAFECYTVENLAKAILPGVYDVTFDYSPRFNQTLPHIHVPVRDQAAGGDAGIRIHAANLPTQLEGCIAVGDKLNPDSVDDSRITLNQLLKIISPVKEGLKLEIKDIPEVIV
jgi:hypothetical protein